MQQLTQENERIIRSWDQLTEDKTNNMIEFLEYFIWTKVFKRQFAVALNISWCSDSRWYYSAVELLKEERRAARREKARLQEN